MARKARESLTFELTPLIDVVFLLLIFFMVSSVFKKEELALLLNLPKAHEGKGETSKVKEITIELKTNELAFNGQKMSFEQLAAELKNLDPKILINLRADKKVYYQELVRILDLLNRNKMQNISLITEKEGKL